MHTKSVPLGDKEQPDVKELLPSQKMLKLGVSQREIIKISKKGDFRNILHENLLKPKIANSGNICKKKETILCILIIILVVFLTKKGHVYRILCQT